MRSSPQRRRFFGAIVGLLLLAAPGRAPAEVVHTVARGHNLQAIARRYAVTVDAIREANKLESDKLRPGDQLIIPEKGGKTGAKAAKDGKKAADKPVKDPKDAKKGAKKDDRSDDKPEKGDKAKKGKAKDEASGRSNDKGAKDKKDKSSHEKAVDRGAATKPKRPGFVRFVRGEEHLEVQVASRKGKLLPASLPKLTRFLRHGPSGAEHPIDPRLASLIAVVSDHFGGKPIHVVSGFRPYSPKQYTPHSNHNLGRAMDFRIEGVSNTTLRDFCLTLNNAGVGYYPNSTFVHLDVRTTKTYWIDYSRPGEAPRYRRAPAAKVEDEALSDTDDATEPEGGSLGTLPGSSVGPQTEGEKSPREVEAGSDAPEVSPKRPTPSAGPSTTSTPGASGAAPASSTSTADPTP